MRLIYCLLLFLCPGLIEAQTIQSSPLTIGDYVPEILFREMKDNSIKRSGLSDFSADLVILDFWATWCSACIKEFPKLETVEAAYNGKVKILLINEPGSGDDISSINTFFIKLRKKQNRKYLFSVVVNDSMAASLFPHESLPHSVWIYKNKVVAITSSDEVTQTNIDAVLLKGSLAIEMQDKVVDFVGTLPLLTAGNGGDDIQLIKRSTFSRYQKGITGRIGKSYSSDSSFVSYYYLNQPAIKIYMLTTGLTGNKIKMNVSKPERFINRSEEPGWKKVNYYSYQTTVSSRIKKTEVNQIIRNDLDNLFGIRSRLEKTEIDCYALVSKPGFEKLIPQEGRNSNQVYPFYKTIGLLVKEMNRQAPGEALRPVILDETNYIKPIRLSLDVEDIQNLDMMKKALSVYGLDIIPCKREVLMLVLSDANQTL